MQLTIKYFGLIAEVTQCSEEVVDFTGTMIRDLLEELYAKYPELKNKDFQVAQHREVVSEHTKITGDEVALLPPFSGG